MRYMLRDNKSGQIGLVLLVVMGVVVSLVLSVATRSFSDITLSRKEKESNAAFSIAESGVEAALLELSRGASSGSGTIPDATNTIIGDYNINVTSSYDLYVNEGETAQIDLSGSPTNVMVHWAKSQEVPGGLCTEGSGNAPAAVELAIFDAGGRVLRSYYNAYGCNLNSVNHFSSSSDGTLGSFTSRAAVSLAGGEQYLRIKPIYNGTTINVSGSGLASQLYLIQSKAAGEDVRTDIEVKRSLAAPGSVFDFAIFSNTSIIKN